MADSSTPNFSLVLVEVGASNDTWGTKLNANFNSLDALLSGASMLTRLLTVDGVNSGLDADKLRGTTPSAFALTLLDDANAATVLGTLGVSAFVQTILDDADAAAVRSTLGLTIGTSGATIPLLNTANTWSAQQTFSVGRTQHEAGATMRSGAGLQLNNAANSVGMTLSNDGTFITASAPMLVTGRVISSQQVRGTGYLSPPAGDGVDVGFSGGTGFIQAFNSSGAVVLPLRVIGTNILMDPGGINVATFRSGAMDLLGILQMENGQGIYGKTSANASRRIMLYHSSDVLYMGGVDSDPATVVIRANGVDRVTANSTGALIGGLLDINRATDQKIILRGSSSPNIYFQNATPATLGVLSVQNNALSFIDSTVANVLFSATATGTFGVGGLELGYRGLPSGSVAALTNGKCWIVAAGQTLNTGFAADSIGAIYNNSATSITLTQGSGLTLRLHGTTTTGSRTLLPRGLCTILAVSTTEYVALGDVT